MNVHHTLEFDLQNQKFRIACREEERGELLKAVAYLDGKMNEVRELGKVINTERVAMLAAIKITHELLGMKAYTGFDLMEFTRRMHDMQSKIDQSLGEQGSLF
jgi:cell division protein ZapA